jgi:uncharacterized membrane protein
MLNALTIFKSIHVLAVAVWVGSDTAMHVFALRAIKAGPEHAAHFVKEIAWYGMVVITGSALVVVIAGFATLGQEHLSLSTTWVSIGFGIWIVSFLTGVAYLTPNARRISAAVGADGTLATAQQAAMGKLLIVMRIELLLLMAAVVDMVVKPG